MSKHNEAYEEVQRYHVHNVGGEDTYCRDEDVAELEAKYAELEAKYQKLLREHTFMIGSLQWIADDGCTVYKKQQIAINSLRYVNAEVMPWMP